jgi:hypothetical protein
MGNFAVIVDIRVVNMDGEPVNYRGHPKMGDRPHTPMVASIKFAEAMTADDANSHLNSVYKVVDVIKSIVEKS